MEIEHSHKPKEQSNSIRAEYLADDPSTQGVDTEDHNNIFYNPSYVVDSDVVDHTVRTPPSCEVVVDSVFLGEVETDTFDAANSQCNQLETFEHFIRPAKSSTKRSRQKHPPPSNELIIGYHENDVLSGRGATINAHPGNVRFRKMCVSRKSEFDIATNSHKRLIATTVVEEIFKLDPPGRFLERVDDATASAFEQQYLSSFDGEVGIDKIMTGSSLQYFKTMGYTPKNKTFMKHLGPWKHFSVEKAIQKACGVIRDHKRPDKVALRAMSKKKKSSREGEPRMTLMESYVPTTGISQDESIGSDHVHSPEKKIIPTCNDVLIGRGAFINNYVGNVKFRMFASQQKNRFDASSGSEKRAISLELVMQIKAQNPPGRFLRRPHSAVHQQFSLSSGKYQLAPRGVEGPWEEVSLDTACMKVCQSMRDLKPEHPLPQSQYTKVYYKQKIQYGLAEYHVPREELDKPAESSNAPSQPSASSATSTFFSDTVVTQAEK